MKKFTFNHISFFQLLVLFLLFLISELTAQPVLTRPFFNATIADAYSKHISLKSNDDTLPIPFFDDFSKTGVYPDNSLWLDNNVYVNQNFGIHPPSIGVATFDILNMAGQIYSHASSNTFIADYLTSKPINLSYFITYNSFSYPTNILFYYESATGIYRPADSLYYYSGPYLLNCVVQPGTFTPTMHVYYGSVSLIDVSDSLYYYDTLTSQYVHIVRYTTSYYSLTDSIYLSFYFQPQGLGGNAPESNDSLVLEFKTPLSDWKHIWSSPGFSDTIFHKVVIPLDSIYLVKGFQFRFYNYASFGNLNYPSFASNVDYWNLDYVYLNTGQRVNDSIYPDICFKEPIRSLVEPPYTSIPWEHYKILDTLQIDTLRFNYYNLYSSLVNVKRFLTINNITNHQQLRFDSLGNDNIGPFETFQFKQKTQPNYFPDNNLNKCTFEVLLNITAPTLSSQSIFTWNDTLRFFQNFEYYYAIDDGSAEYGVGLSGEGSQNGQFAMLFKTLTPDTLRAVDMFFNRTLNNASQKYFYLTIWTVNKGKPNHIIYKKTGFKPEYAGINEFHRYSLDTTIYVTDSIFIGWTQTSTDLLNLGFDLNYDYSSNVFYNLNGSWTKLPFNGTPMIRPVFSKSQIINVEEEYMPLTFIPYPNPANNKIFLCDEHICSYILYDITGKIILQGFSQSIDTSPLENGIYILQIFHNKQTSSHKIIIQHP
ncbi:MAG: T9SS type A sorting domain-containing protein [Bacteroidales bacterium]|nr:T9SS type A sorting domain-containing protein [Bacteroidales bacterium]